MQAAKGGQAGFQRPYVGATFEPVTSRHGRGTGAESALCALAMSAAWHPPVPEKAGLRPGEVVVAVNGMPVEHPDALGYRLTTPASGRRSP